MSIFLGYGFSLGLVGSGAGMVFGLLFVAYINQIAAGLEWLSGQEVFDPTVYYFEKIPVIVEPFTAEPVQFDVTADEIEFIFGATHDVATLEDVSGSDGLMRSIMPR